MKRIWIGCLLVTLGFGFTRNAAAIGLIVVDEEGAANALQQPDPRFPHPWLPRPIHRFTPLELKSAKVSSSINDQVAHTKIEEEFYNPNPRRLEGTFLLPLPKGAHLEKFAMEVNGKMTEAELLSADKARGIYEEIVRKAKDPALLEYVGRDLLKVRIFPIEPNSTKKVELTYDQLLKSDSGMIEYSFPLNTAQYASTPIGVFSLRIALESSTPLKTIYSPSHSIEILRKTDKTATIGLEESGAKPDKDFQLFYSAQQRELGLSFLTYKEAGEDGYFMLLASPGFGSKQRVLPKDVVFVLDTSGSMNGKKLTQAKKALTFCVNNLNPEDRFEIIRFSTETESLFKKLAPVSDDTRHEAESFVENLKTIGGTAINDALKKALSIRPMESSRPFLVVFLTDGLPTVGDTSESGILRTVTEKTRDLTRIFCFGIGTDVNTRLLDRIAEETSAVSQYVLPDEDIEVKVSSFFAKISDPVLAGVELDLGKVRTSKIYPAKLPDLFKGQQLIVLGRYTGSGKTTAQLSGKAGDREEHFSYPLEFPDRTTDRKFIPRLWAMRRVGYLLEEIRSHGQNDELKEEITELGRKYGIATPYTSFLVQEDQRLATAAEPGTYDPLAFYRRNPELMKRYFPQLYQQKEVLAERERLLVAPDARSGDAAVASSRYSSSLRLADTEQQVRVAGREVLAYATTGKAQSAAAAPALNELLTRNVAGRSFQLVGSVWIESSALEKKEAQPVQLRFDSKEYWAFVAAHPELREVLALGTNVKFLFTGKLYEVLPAQ